MRGKLIEDVVTLQVFEPAQRVTAVTLYNGNQVATTGNGIDTRDCDEIVFVLNAGTFVGATLEADIVQSNTDDPSGATLVSGNASPNDTANTNASFTNVTIANDRQLHTLSIKSKNFNRYMWLRTYLQAGTAPYSAIAELGKCDRDPDAQASTPVVDLNY